MPIGLSTGLGLLERLQGVWTPEQDGVGDQTADSKVLGKTIPSVGTR